MKLALLAKWYLDGLISEDEFFERIWEIQYKERHGAEALKHYKSMLVKR